MSAEKYFDRISSIGKLRPLPGKEMPFYRKYKPELPDMHAVMGTEFDKVIDEMLREFKVWAGPGGPAFFLRDFKFDPKVHVKAPRVPSPKPGCKKCGGSGKRPVQLLTSVVYDPCDCVS